MKKNEKIDFLSILQSEKSGICISIISPTHPLAPDRRVDPVQLERAIQTAKNDLQSRYGNAVADALAQKALLYRG